MSNEQRRWNPDGVPKPFGRYSQAALVTAPRHLLTLSGQVGVAADGTVPDDVKDQAELIFAQIDRCLAEAGMGRQHVQRLTTYLTDIAYRPIVMAVRDAWVTDPPPASTLLVIKALATPVMKVEIEVIAAD